MFRRFTAVSLVLFLSLGLCLAAAGCAKKEKAEKEAGKEVTGEKGEQGKEKPPESADASRTVTMNGRSVMGGWMEHWGYDWQGPVRKNGCLLDYKELNSDLSEIANSFAGNTEGLPQGSVVFFKFCFADFDGGNLSRLENIVGKVVEVARERGFRLILGNALPVRAADGSKELVAEYGEYNAFLKKTASENPNVWVYDFYGVLAGPDGFLKPEYDTGDSHPNGRAYAALDGTFFPLLDNIFGKQVVR